MNIGDNVDGTVAHFFNDGDDPTRHGISIQCGPDVAQEDHFFIRFMDGDGDIVGAIRSQDGVLSFVESSVFEYWSKCS